MLVFGYGCDGEAGLGMVWQNRASNELWTLALALERETMNRIMVWHDRYDSPVLRWSTSAKYRAVPHTMDVFNVLALNVISN